MLPQNPSFLPHKIFVVPPQYSPSGKYLLLLNKADGGEVETVDWLTARDFIPGAADQHLMIGAFGDSKIVAFNPTGILDSSGLLNTGQIVCFWDREEVELCAPSFITAETYALVLAILAFLELKFPFPALFPQK